MRPNGVGLRRTRSSCSGAIEPVYECGPPPPEAQRPVAFTPGEEHEKESLTVAASLACGTKERPMDVVGLCCCGLDVHKAAAPACVGWADTGGKKRHEKRPFATVTRDLLALTDWLRACRVTHVAMESTGVY